MLSLPHESQAVSGGSGLKSIIYVCCLVPTNLQGEVGHLRLELARVRRELETSRRMEQSIMVRAGPIAIALLTSMLKGWWCVPCCFGWNET